MSQDLDPVYEVDWIDVKLWLIAFVVGSAGYYTGLSFVGVTLSFVGAVLLASYLVALGYGFINSVKMSVVG